MSLISAPHILRFLSTPALLPQYEKFPAKQQHRFRIHKERFDRAEQADAFSEKESSGREPDTIPDKTGRNRFREKKK